jgi:hypothetical protein
MRKKRKKYLQPKDILDVSWAFSPPSSSLPPPGGSLVSPPPPVGLIVPVPPRPCCPAVVWFVVVLSLFVPSRPPLAPSFPSRYSPFPPREQLLAAMEWGAAVVAAAAVVIAVIPTFPVIVVVWSSDLADSHRPPCSCRPRHPRRSIDLTVLIALAVLLLVMA